jgi:hypothetical protein
MYATIRIAFNSGVGHLILKVLEQLRAKCTAKHITHNGGCSRTSTAYQFQYRVGKCLSVPG